MSLLDIISNPRRRVQKTKLAVEVVKRKSNLRHSPPLIKKDNPDLVHPARNPKVLFTTFDLNNKDLFLVMRLRKFGYKYFGYHKCSWTFESRLKRQLIFLKGKVKMIMIIEDCEKLIATKGIICHSSLERIPSFDDIYTNEN